MNEILWIYASFPHFEFYLFFSLLSGGLLYLECYLKMGCFRGGNFFSLMKIPYIIIGSNFV